jgi:hypothetical protein
LIFGNFTLRDPNHLYNERRLNKHFQDRL